MKGLKNTTLKDQIQQANIASHRIEARYFQMLHPEIYNVIEQRRLDKSLEKASRLISSNGKKALDFGAGIGVITGKLLQMGYDVTAVDISKEMCKVLENKYDDYVSKDMLHIVNSSIDDTKLDCKEFDFITCYAVLHHLPDYEQTIRNVALHLKKGGIIYLDHEISPCQSSDQRIRRMYYSSDRILNHCTGMTYFRNRTVADDIRSINYSESILADYWAQPERKIDHFKIEQLFRKLNFTFYLRQDYHLHRTRIVNPFFLIFKYASAPDVSCWIAKR